MIWLSGGVRADMYGRHPALGIMLTPNMGNRPDHRTWWGADTGLYSAKGERTFDLDRYLAWLTRWRPYQARCLFATAPDKVGDARTTWACSRDVLPRIRELGYRAALVGQDGLEDLELDWGAFDVFFVGGSTAWKLSEAAFGLVAEAKRRGKWAHQGRCNSRRRLIAAALSGYDSADGTYVAYGPDVNLPRVLAWLDGLKAQPPLPLFTTGGAA